MNTKQKTGYKKANCSSGSEAIRYSFTIHDIVFYTWSMLVLGALCCMLWLFHTMPTTCSTCKDVKIITVRINGKFSMYCLYTIESFPSIFILSN